MTDISALAHVHPSARIGEGTVIGEFSVVRANVVLGDGCRIGSHCLLGEPSSGEDGPLVIGAGAVIRSHSVVYAGSRIGVNLTTGHGVTIRERSALGDGVQIGTNTELQGDLTVGDYTRTQSSVFIPKYCTIGRFVWLMPFVCLTNDPRPPSDPADEGPTIEDYAVLAARVVVLPGVRIGARSVVGAQSLVTRDVEADTVVMGTPAKKRGWTKDLARKDGKPAYPWTRHFRRGYPNEVIAAWNRGSDE